MTAKLLQTCAAHQIGELLRRELDPSWSALIGTRKPEGGYWTREDLEAARDATDAEAKTMKGTGDFDPNEEPSRDPWTGLYGPRR